MRPPTHQLDHSANTITVNARSMYLGDHRPALLTSATTASVVSSMIGVVVDLEVLVVVCTLVVTSRPTTADG